MDSGGKNKIAVFTLRAETASICGIRHVLVESSRGDLFWVDDLFLDLLRGAHSRLDAEALASRFGVGVEAVRAGAAAVENLFFGDQGIKYFSTAGEEYLHPRHNPLISIVIVNWNGEQHLGELLESIRAQSYRHYEIIVLDNGSTDNSLGLLDSFKDVRVLRQEGNVGFCRGNNLGIRAANGEILLLLNNDTVLDNRCLEHAVNCFAEAPEDTFAIFPKMLFYQNPMIINCTKTQWHCLHLWRDNSVGLLDLRRVEKREQVFGGIFAGVFMRKALFEKLGLFDEAFVTYGEDFDVCYRANLAGYKLFSEPRSIVYHKYRTSSREETDIFFTLYYFLRNYLIVILKNYELKHIPAAVRYFRKEFWGPWATRARLQGDRAVRKLLRRVIKSLMLLAPHIVRERVRLRRTRKIMDKDLWVFDNLDHYNIFHYNGRVVLNAINLAASIHGNARYTVNGKEHLVFGSSRYIPMSVQPVAPLWCKKK